jgi:hypothetical protein
MLKRVVRKIIRDTRKIVLPANDPGFFIIGAQKSGTTSLYFYLVQHPKICSGETKEIGFFHRDMYFGKTLEQYRKDFTGSKDCLYIDATVEYLAHPDVAKNIYDVYPNTKIIVVLRDPVKRAYSAWNHYRQHFESGRYINAIQKPPRRNGNLLFSSFFENRKQFPSFRECLEIELDLIEKGEGFEPAIIRRGFYLSQLEEYWRYFDKDQIKIIGFKDFVSDVKGTLSDIEDFLGVEKHNWSNLVEEPRNKRMYQEPILEGDAAFLTKIYEEPNQKLFEAVGSLNW